MRKVAWEHWFGAGGWLLLSMGAYGGLAIAPPERYMGEIGRILYIHVPTAWMALISFTAAFFLSIAFLATRRRHWDDALVGALETGILLTGMLLVQGAIWARPTWGVYWDWDPRLTTSAIMWVAFIGVLGLRSFVEDPFRRAQWCAVATILAYVDVPIVYWSIYWWRSLHQGFSTAETIHVTMRVPLYLNAVAMLFIAIWLIARRTRLVAYKRRMQEQSVMRPQQSTLTAGD